MGLVESEWHINLRSTTHTKPKFCVSIGVGVTHPPKWPLTNLFLAGPLRTRKNCLKMTWIFLTWVNDPPLHDPFGGPKNTKWGSGKRVSRRCHPVTTNNHLSNRWIGSNSHNAQGIILLGVPRGSVNQPSPFNNKKMHLTFGTLHFFVCKIYFCFLMPPKLRRPKAQDFWGFFETLSFLSPHAFLPWFPWFQTSRFFAGLLLKTSVFF